MAPGQAPDRLRPVPVHLCWKVQQYIEELQREEWEQNGSPMAAYCAYLCLYYDSWCMCRKVALEQPQFLSL